jgi:hypothetical protein
MKTLISILAGLLALGGFLTIGVMLIGTILGYQLWDGAYFAAALATGIVSWIVCALTLPKKILKIFTAE